VTAPLLALKVDVDTERGTRLGVPALSAKLKNRGIAATFLFSLGPDNTGRAIRRVFRRGFLGKVVRTSVVSTYGLRTLMNGVLLPGPHIARRHGDILRAVSDDGHEVGIHCYDHIRWQDGLARMSPPRVQEEFDKARVEFEKVFGTPALTAGAAGWQANAASLAAYDRAGLLYASDARGERPFFPRVDGCTFRTLQVPTTLPTLDELLGRPEYPETAIVEHYLGLLRPGLNVLTAHAEIEGMAKAALFDALLEGLRRQEVEFVRLDGFVRAELADRARIPVCALEQGVVDGRSGTLAVQGGCEAAPASAAPSAAASGGH